MCPFHHSASNISTSLMMAYWLPLPLAPVWRSWTSHHPPPPHSDSAHCSNSFESTPLCSLQTKNTKLWAVELKLALLELWLKLDFPSNQSSGPSGCHKGKFFTFAEATSWVWWRTVQVKKTNELQLGDIQMLILHHPECMNFTECFTITHNHTVTQSH